MAEITTVFLSSVSAELNDYRMAARSALDSLPGVKVVAMESFNAEDSSAVEHCIRQVEECDLFFGIVGSRYGSTLSEGGKSFCEIEYDVARVIGIPCFMFLPSPEALFPTPISEPAWKGKRQGEFIARVLFDRQCGFFASPQELALQAVSSLRNHERGTRKPGYAPPVRNSLAGLGNAEELEAAIRTVGRENPEVPQWKKTILLFPFVTGQGGFDTAIVVTNTSAAPFSEPSIGACSIHYFGSNPEGEMPATQISSVVGPGKQLIFSTAFGGNLGVDATREFQGYIVVRCDFAPAVGYAQIMRASGTGPGTSYLAEKIDSSQPSPRPSEAESTR
jgi:hypothetical protein